MTRWTLADMPPQTGRLAVVTGANSGIGLETARTLVDAGARVIVAARNETKGRAAAAAIGGQAEWRALDLADLAAVKTFSDRLLAEGTPIDMLILNAGVMALPKRATTVDGFEMQLGTNFLGHFALSARLCPLIAQDGRVVPLSSIAARRGGVDFDDLMGAAHYNAWAAYSQSKLAMLIFAIELAKRQQRVASIAAHPGFARTNLIANGMGKNALRDTVIRVFGDLFSQSAAAGALPVLRAATDPTMRSGGYVGSTGLFELKGPPGPAKIPRAACDPETGRRLWAAAETLTGLSFRP
jgi:NAD(P)-dependent dehydrogenase (short-subunit alcohol dehydrogenase family)